MKIKYIERRETYKYELTEDYYVYIPELRSAPDVQTKFASLQNGNLFIKASFMWDGASGPTYDSPSSMRPSLVHDVTCEFVRLGLLPEIWVPILNAVFYRMCREDGMNWIRAKYWLLALKLTKGTFWGKKQDPPEVKEAP